MPWSAFWYWSQGCLHNNSVLSCRHQTSCWSQRRTKVRWCIRDGALPALHLHYPQFKTHAEPGQRGDTAAAQTNKHSQTAVIAQGLDSNLSQVPGKLTGRLTTAEASAHKSAFYILIILWYTKQYLALLSHLFTKQQKLMAAEKPC